MSASKAPLAFYKRKPRRVSVTVSQGVMDRLQLRSDEQGRSTSNLAAHLIEIALDAMDGKPPIPKTWPGKAG